MNKYKVFYAAGSQQFAAAYYKIEWKFSDGVGHQGVLRLYNKDDAVIAIFPPGGWLGLHEMTG